MKKSITKTEYRRITRIIVFCLMLCLAFAPAVFVHAADSVYQINNTADFLEFADHCRLDSWSKNRTVYLNRDIDLSGYAFSGVPSFSGTFEGQGNRIKGFQNAGDDDYIGIFKYIEKSGTVRNLTVDADIRSEVSGSYIGGIAAVNCGLIYGCRFEGSVNAAGVSGGIAGYNAECGIVSSCVNAGHIISEENTGGIAGENKGTLTNCENTGDVNNDSSWVDASGNVSVEKLLEGFDPDSGKNIGGICGRNEGLISECSNNAAVGYLNSGENIGGISGYSDGHIEGCLNSGIVCGKNNVGGIIGHMQPYIIEDQSDSLRPQLSRLHDNLQDLIDDTEAMRKAVDGDASDLSKQIRDTIDTANAISDELVRVTNSNVAGVNELTESADYIIERSSYLNTDLAAAVGYLDMVRSDIDNIRSDLDQAQAGGIGGAGSAASALNTDLSTLSADLGSMSVELKRAMTELKTISDYLNSRRGTFRLTGFSAQFDKNIDKLADGLKAITDGADKIRADFNRHSDTVEDDLRDLNSDVAKTADTAYDVYDRLEEMLNGEDVYKDHSASNPNYEKASSVKKSENRGPVYGQRNVGGIIGDSDVEKIDAVSETGIQVGKQYFVYLLLSLCRNTGYISAGKSNAGSVAGYQNYGLISDSTGSGFVDSPSAEYVGGIAGLSNAVIKSCSSLAVLSGSSYVGGIAGDGYEIHDSLSLAQVSGCKSRSGAIAGADTSHDDEIITDYRAGMAKRISGNYYCSSKLFGIDGVSYENIAEPVTYEELIAMKNAAKDFSDLKIVFMNPDGNIVREYDCEYGQSLSDISYPQFATPEGRYISWKGAVTDTAEGNVVMHAEITDNISILASTEKINGKAAALAQGAFTEKSELIAETLTLNESGLTESGIKIEEGSFVKVYRAELKGTRLKDDSTTKLRLYDGQEYSAKAYVLDGDSWKEIPSKRIGRYVEVEMTGTKAVVLIVSGSLHEEVKRFALPAACVAVLAAAAAGIVIRHIKKKRNKNTAA